VTTKTSDKLINTNSLNHQISLLLELTLEEVDSLLGVGALLTIHVTDDSFPFQWVINHRR
jgi:hypothetical protein